MAIRTIVWTVKDDMTVTPTNIQNAGVQGDNNVTRAEFSLPSSLCSGYTLYVEYVDAAGGYDKTEPLKVTNNKVGCLIPLSWTQLGGKATIRLVATKISGDTDSETAYTWEGRISYHSRSNVVGKIDSLIRGCLQAVLDAVRKATVDAKEAAENAEAVVEKLEDSASLADEAIVAANEALERAESVKGVYVGTGEMPEGYNVQIDPSGETDIVSIACGGTGATDAETARQNLGVVPLGLGFGAVKWYTGDIDDITKTGVYSIHEDNTSENKPTTLGELIHIERTDEIATQIWINDNYGYPALILRKKSGGEWKSWLYQNPAMINGTEYLTMERYKGNAVYRKLVTYTPSETIVGSGDTGTMVKIAHYITDFGELVRCSATVSGDKELKEFYALPCSSNTGGTTSIMRVNNTEIIVSVYKMQWLINNTFSVILYYTKS